MGCFAINTDVRYVLWLLDFLSERGCDTESLIKTHQLNNLDQLDVPISSAAHRALLSDALRMTGNTGLGLEIGFHRSQATYDQLAYLMMSSSTLREATELGLRYQNYPGRFSGNEIITTFSEIDGQGCYQINTKDSLGEFRLLAVEDVLSSIMSTVRWVIGRPLPVTKLRCDYPKPPHFEAYQKIFDCPIHFDAPVIQLFFDADVLDQPLPNTSPQSARLYAALCEEKSIARQQGDVAWRLSQIIAQDSANPPEMTEAAALLHCSPRTLRRRLKAEGWQYQQLIDQVRTIRARRALSDPTLSITEIALQLGFADHSGFLRAFKKWTGLTPSEFRSRLLN